MSEPVSAARETVLPAPYILRSNLIAALTVAIQQRTIAESRHAANSGMTYRSAMLAGWEANLVALKQGLPFEVRE